MKIYPSNMNHLRYTKPTAQEIQEQYYFPCSITVLNLTTKIAEVFYYDGDGAECALGKTEIPSDYLIKKSLSKTDAAPTVIGLYPLEETGTYANLGNINAEEGKLNFASFNGSSWSLLGITMPKGDDGKTIETWSAKVFVSGSQVFYNGKIYEASENTLSTDVPSFANIWDLKFDSNNETVNDILDNIKKTPINYTNSAFINKSTFLKQDGTVHDAPGWATTDYISVKKDDLIKINVYGITETYNVSQLLFFDTNKANPINLISAPNDEKYNSVIYKQTTIAPADGFIKVGNRTENGKTDYGFSAGVITAKIYATPNDIQKTITIDLTTTDKSDIVITGSGGIYNGSGTWVSWYSKKINIEDLKHFKGKGSAFNSNGISIPALVIYDSSNNVIQYYDCPINTQESKISFDFDITSQMSYCILQWNANEVTENVILTADLYYESKPNLSLILPSKVYNVANNIDIQKGRGRKITRNFSSVLYLDNFIKSADKEYNLRFSNGATKFQINAYTPVITEGAIETPNFNNGLATYDETINFSIIGNSKDSKYVSILNRSVLNSSSSAKKPIILIIGDSVTYGQNAYFPDSNDKWNYTMLLNNMFLKDKTQNGGTGYDFLTIGTILFTDTNGNRSCNEGYSGTTLQGVGLFQNPKFLNGNTFSFATWLSKYRTCDDNGNRLYFTASKATTGTGGGVGYDANGNATSFNIGTEVTNVMAFDVCKPTHIFVFHASNREVLKADYDQLITYARADFPNVIIGLGCPHVAGSYFPSLYPNIYKPSVWDNDTGYNVRHVNTQTTLNSIDADSNYEANKVYVLPTFFVNPSANAFSMISVNEPFMDVLNSGETLMKPVGQCVDVHVGSSAHSSYAYQIYSWLKWTIAKGLF